MLGGRAGAEPELHAVLHMLQRVRRRLPLQFVHIHVLTMPLKNRARRGISSVVLAPRNSAMVDAFWPEIGYRLCRRRLHEGAQTDSEFA